MTLYNALIYHNLFGNYDVENVLVSIKGYPARWENPCFFIQNDALFNSALSTYRFECLQELV